MNLKPYIVFVCILFIIQTASSQSEFIRSKEGSPILNRRDMVYNCLHSLHTDRLNKSALAICECQVNMLDRHLDN